MTRLTLTNGPLLVELDLRGAAVNRWIVHDPDPVDLVLGHAHLGDRVRSTFYMGEVVGPVANRIAGGSFPWEGGRRTLVANDRGNTLHGGPDGFSTKDWAVLEASGTEATLGLEWTDPSGGFPGTYRVRITYTLGEDELSHRIVLAVDEPTVANPCVHPYFNLAGAGDVRDHVLTLDADAYLAVDATGIPLPGAPASVQDTRLDLRSGARLGDVGEVDHAFVLAGGRPAAVLEHPGSGRRLEVATDRPSLQVFTGSALGEAVHLRTPAVPFGGVALETQGLPDAPNRPDFPSVVVTPEEPLVTSTSWRLGRR